MSLFRMLALFCVVLSLRDAAFHLCLENHGDNTTDYYKVCARHE